MIEVTSSVQIERSAADVYAFLVDMSNAPSWQSGAFEAKVLTEGPIRAGTRFSERFRMAGVQMTAVCEMTAVEPAQQLAYRSIQSRVISFEGSFTLEPEDGATRLTYRATSRLRGPLRLLEPLMRGEVAREAEAELQRIKKAVEERSGQRAQQRQAG